MKNGSPWIGEERTRGERVGDLEHDLHVLVQLGAVPDVEPRAEGAERLDREQVLVRGRGAEQVTVDAVAESYPAEPQLAAQLLGIGIDDRRIASCYSARGSQSVPSGRSLSTESPPSGVVSITAASSSEASSPMIPSAKASASSSG